MKYVAIVELEYQTNGEPLEALRHILRIDELDHYHIVELPRPLPFAAPASEELVAEHIERK